MLTSDQLSKGLWSSNTDEWATPQYVFDEWNERYHFTLDPASSDDNAKCVNHYTKEDDGLHKPWGGQTVWLNPPYGKTIGQWVRKAYEESKQGATVVCLLPARTDTAWFHEYCLQGEIVFIRGRLRFGGAKWNAPFPSMIVIFKENND